MIQPGGRPIDVGIEFFLRRHNSFDRVGDRFQFHIPRFSCQLHTYGFKMFGSRITLFENTMAKTHDTLLAPQSFMNPCLGFIGRTNLIEHFQYESVGPAVERPFQAPMAAVTAECKSESVEATTRAVKVEVLNSSSA